MLVEPTGVQSWAILQVLVQPTPAARPGAFNPARALPNGLQLADLFTKASAKGDLPFDLWDRLSFGRVKITGSTVFGPFDAIRKDGMRATTDDWDNMYDDEAANKWDRGQKVLSGIRGALKQGIDLSPFWGVVVVPDYQIDSFGSYAYADVVGVTREMGQVLLDYNDLSSAHTMHEMGHGFGFDHTCGDFNPDPGGDYGDPADVMSFARCRSYKGTDGKTGPGFSAASLWLRSWLPPDVTVIFAQSGIPDATYTLSPLYAPALAPGSTRTLIVDVLHSGRYVNREVFFVEYRSNREDIDAGFNHSAVFVHRIRSVQGEFENKPWLVAPNAGSPRVDSKGLVPQGAGWIDSGAGFGIGIVDIDSVADIATVRVSPAVATISLSESLETLSEEEIGFDVEDWPGAILATSPECVPREFEYIVLSRQQQITLVAGPGGGLDPSHPVNWAVAGSPVTTSGPVSFLLTYESPKRQVTLDAEISGHTLVLRNRPADGEIKFYVEVFADPPVPGIGASVTSLQFDGIGRRYENPEHDAIVERCRRESAAALRNVFGHISLKRHVSPGEPVQHLNERDLQRIVTVLEPFVAHIRPR